MSIAVCSGAPGTLCIYVSLKTAGIPEPDPQGGQGNWFHEMQYFSASLGAVCYWAIHNVRPFYPRQIPGKSFPLGLCGKC